MKLAGLDGLLSRPAHARRALFLDLGRLGLFVFGVLAATGLLLALWYRPSADAAYESLVHVTNTVSLGWLVRSLHRFAGHLLVALVALYVVRGFFQRRFLGPHGPAMWRISVAFAFVCAGLLVTGAALPWNQAAVRQAVADTDALAAVPVAGARLASVLRGGEKVGDGTVARLFAAHVVLLPWIALGLLALAHEVRRNRGPDPASTVRDVLPQRVAGAAAVLGVITIAAANLPATLGAREGAPADARASWPLVPWRVAADAAPSWLPAGLLVLAGAVVLFCWPVVGRRLAEKAPRAHTALGVAFLLAVAALVAREISR